MLTTSRRLLGITLFATIALAACSDDEDSGSTTPSKVAGTYTMTSVNNGSLPATTELSIGGGHVEITGGSFVLRSDNTYTETINTRTVAANGSATTGTQTESGTFALNGSTISFTLPATATDAAFSYAGTINGKTLSYVFSNTLIVYTKE